MYGKLIGGSMTKAAQQFLPHTIEGGANMTFNQLVRRKQANEFIDDDLKKVLRRKQMRVAQALDDETNPANLEMDMQRLDDQFNAAFQSYINSIDTKNANELNNMINATTNTQSNSYMGILMAYNNCARIVSHAAFDNSSKMKYANIMQQSLPVLSTFIDALQINIKQGLYKLDPNNKLNYHTLGNKLSGLTALLMVYRNVADGKLSPVSFDEIRQNFNGTIKKIYPDKYSLIIGTLMKGSPDLKQDLHALHIEKGAITPGDYDRLMNFKVNKLPFDEFINRHMLDSSLSNVMDTALPNEPIIPSTPPSPPARPSTLPLPPPLISSEPSTPRASSDDASRSGTPEPDADIETDTGDEVADRINNIYNTVKNDKSPTQFERAVNFKNQLQKYINENVVGKTPERIKYAETILAKTDELLQKISAPHTDDKTDSFMRLHNDKYESIKDDDTPYQSEKANQYKNRLKLYIDENEEGKTPEREEYAKKMLEKINKLIDKIHASSKSQPAAAPAAPVLYKNLSNGEKLKVYPQYFEENPLEISKYKGKPGKTYIEEDGDVAGKYHVKKGADLRNFADIQPDVEKWYNAKQRALASQTAPAAVSGEGMRRTHNKPFMQYDPVKEIHNFR